MNRMQTGFYSASIQRKRWLTSDAPGASDANGGHLSRNAGALGADASLDYATRTKQLAKELARGFSAPEALHPRHASTRRTVTDLAGKSSLDHYSRLPGGHIAARAAVAIAAAKGSIELRRCHTARIAVQRQAILAPQLSQARIVKKPRLSLSPTRSRPRRPDNSEDGEIEERPAPRFVRIPRSQPAPDADFLSPTATNLDDSPSVHRHSKDRPNSVMSPTASPLTEAQKKEEQWYKETLAALVDEDLREGSLSTATCTLRALAVHKADPNLPTALTIPKECVAFKRAPFRHIRASVRDLGRMGMYHFPGQMLTPVQSKRTAFINLVDSQPQETNKGQMDEVIPSEGLNTSMEKSNLATIGLESRHGQPDTVALPNGGEGKPAAAGADIPKISTGKDGISKESELLNEAAPKLPVASAVQEPATSNFVMATPVIRDAGAACRTREEEHRASKGMLPSAGEDGGVSVMDGIEGGFRIRKKAPLSHLQKLRSGITLMAEEVEEAKGSVRRQDKIVSPKGVGPKTPFSRKLLLQRRKSYEQKQKAIQRRQIMRRPGSTSVHKAGLPMRNGRQDSLDPQDTIAVNRPRRKARANGQSIIDLSESSSDMDLDNDSTSKSADIFRPPVRKARRVSTPTPATRPSRSSPRKLPRTLRNSVGNADGNDTPDRLKRIVHRTSNGLQKTEPLKEKVVSAKPNVGEETQSSERPEAEAVKYADGHKCIRFSRVYYDEGAESPYMSSSDDEDEDEDLEDVHISTIPALQRLSAFDKRRSNQKGVFGLPEGIDDEAIMVDRLSKQHDLFSDDENAGLPVMEDSLASKFVVSHAGEAKQTRLDELIVGEPAPQRAALKMEGSTVVHSNGAASSGQNQKSIAMDGVLLTTPLNPLLSDEEESAEAKAKNLQSRVCGDMIANMSEDGKRKVMQWAIRDFSWFDEDTEIMEVTLSCTGVTCDRCTSVQDTMGLCEESIVLKLWRDMTWRKVRRLRHVLGNEV